MFQSSISIASLIISIATFVIAFSVQFYYFISNRKKLKVVRNFFAKKRDFYSVYSNMNHFLLIICNCSFEQIVVRCQLLTILMISCMIKISDNK